ncbi:MAG: NADH-quinone oxidoreductase subunit J [Planctomycetota bacterium]
MNALFVLAALVTAFGAVLVVAGKNLVRCVMALALALLGTAVVYALLGATFLAGVQVLTYVGGVVTLMIFGVMVTRRHEGANAPAERVHGFRGLVLAVGTFALLAWAVLKSDLDSGVPPITQETTRSLAKALLDDHLVAFEVVSLLLLAAILGAVVLARRRDGRDEGSAILSAATREVVEAQSPAAERELVGSARGGEPR